MLKNSRIHCLYCDHFNVTWDARFPHGCKLFGVKSKGMPSQIVAEATGAPCEHFTPKIKKEG